MFKKFCSINKFSSAIKNLNYFYSKGMVEFEGEKEVTFLGKPKLHGTNAGVILTPDGEVIPQKRGSTITGDNTHFGFSDFVAEHFSRFNADMFANLAKNIKEKLDDNRLDQGVQKIIIYGEWAGQDIQKTDVVSTLEKRFYVFSALINDDVFVYCPSLLRDIIRLSGNSTMIPYHMGSRGNQSPFVIIPYYCSTVFYLDPLKEKENQDSIDHVNKLVDAMEECDPFIKDYFNAHGPGEGYVFYPVVVNEVPYTDYMSMVFKAKTESHTSKTQKGVKAKVSVAPEVYSFVEEHLHQGRLEQSWTEMWGENEDQADMTKLGNFIKWCLEDIKKECTEELEASGIEQKYLNKVVANTAKNWYINKLNSMPVKIG